jgi:hypothetical protein
MTATVANNQLYVKSHARRDFEQTAAVFRTEKQVVWEYVSNGLQYVDPGVNPVVRVTLDAKNKRITIADNGRGMTWKDLENFFVMHGENQDRKRGLAGRGRFGTGKSAAFGIASKLRITTNRLGKRSSVELSRKDVETMGSADSIPVRTIEREVATKDPNGTIVEISEINLRTLDQAGIIAFIERHLAKWSKNATVFVNNHECEFEEPAVAETKTFSPEGEAKTALGDVTLTLKVAKAPLDQELRGVSVFANGVWYETTLAGSEGREMSQYIFGEIDVPKLDQDTSPIPPFDQTRSMQLNPSNDLVRAIYAFVGQKVEEVRKGLVEAERKRRESEDAKRLRSQASEIARVINEDFNAFRQRLAQTRAKAKGGTDLYGAEPGGKGPGDDLAAGTSVPATVVAPIGGIGSTGGNGGSGGVPRRLSPQVTPAGDDAELKGQSAGGAQGKAKPSGGFDVQFLNMGDQDFRAKYEADQRVINVNLDHPQLATAKASSSIDDPTFKRLAYEVAFSEYAMALAQELANSGEYTELYEPVVDVRRTLDRVSRQAASLYA